MKILSKKVKTCPIKFNISKKLTKSKNSHDLDHDQDYKQTMAKIKTKTRTRQTPRIKPGPRWTKIKFKTMPIILKLE